MLKFCPFSMSFSALRASSLGTVRSRVVFAARASKGPVAHSAALIRSYSAMSGSFKVKPAARVSGQKQDVW